MMKMTMTVLLAVLMMASSVFVLEGDPSDVSALPPGRAIDHNLIGYMLNITNVTGYKVFATGRDTSVNPPAVVGPYQGIWTNETVYQFSIGVDITSHTVGAPWVLNFTDRYGWNESAGGFINVFPDPDFYTTESVYYLDESDYPNYFPGVMGNITFTVLNGSSGEPLEGVAFNFPEHWLHTTSISGNVTDQNGDVTFTDMQLGLDVNNLVKVLFIKEHFSTQDRTGYGYFPLREGVTTHYTVTLREDDLVRSVTPSDGSVDVVASKDKIDISVRFNSIVNSTSIKDSTVWLEDPLGAKVPVVHTVNQDWVYLSPAVDLEFNSTYRIVVDTGVRDLANQPLLWRKFQSSFTTHKAPGIVRGVVTVSGSTDPAPEGTSIRLDNNLEQTLVSGSFLFPAVSEGSHFLVVVGPSVSGIPEYSYIGMTSPSFEVMRGDDLVIPGLMVTERPTVEVHLRIMDEYAEPLEGVSVIHTITGATAVSDAEGIAIFQDMRAIYSHNFQLSRVHYGSRTIDVLVNELDPTVYNVTLYEDDFPLMVEARVSGTPMEDGAIVPTDSFFLLTFQKKMNVETMIDANLKLLDSAEQEVEVDIYNSTNTLTQWIVDPREEMSYGSTYRLFVSRFVADEFGDNPLWRDLYITFSTQALEPAGISGKVVIDSNRGIGGLDLSVKHGTSTLGTSTTDDNGDFSLTVPMNRRSLTDVFISVDGAKYGLKEGLRFGLTLVSDSILSEVIVEMEREEDWFTVSYPADGTGRMVRNGSITITFDRGLDYSEDFERNFTLGNVPVTVSQTPDGKGVVVDPDLDLEYGTEYVLSISYFPDIDYHRELRFQDGTPALIRGNKTAIRTQISPLEVTLQSPGADQLGSLPRDPKFVIRFSHAVVSDTVEEQIRMYRIVDEKPISMTFSWGFENKAVDLQPDTDLNPQTRYAIELPMGEYGTGKESMVQDYVLEFRTGDFKDITIRPVPNFPADSIAPQEMSLTGISNPKGYPVRVVISYTVKDSSLPYTEIANFTLGPLETKNDLVLDLKDLKKGVYEFKVSVYDGVEVNALLNDYPLYLTIRDEDNGGIKDLTWLFVLVAIVLLILLAAAGIFIYMQTRKKEESGESVEEFECPECHNTVSDNDTVCPHCGAEFEEEAYKCPKCGTLLDPDDDECSECGYDFSDQDTMEIDTDDYEIEEDEEESEELLEMDEE